MFGTMLGINCIILEAGIFVLLVPTLLSSRKAIWELNHMCFSLISPHGTQYIGKKWKKFWQTSPFHLYNQNLRYICYAYLVGWTSVPDRGRVAYVLLYVFRTYPNPSGVLTFSGTGSWVPSERFLFRWHGTGKHQNYLHLYPSECFSSKSSKLWVCKILSRVKYDLMNLHSIYLEGFRTVQTDLSRIRMIQNCSDWFRLIFDYSDGFRSIPHGGSYRNWHDMLHWHLLGIDFMTISCNMFVFLELQDFILDSQGCEGRNPQSHPSKVDSQWVMSNGISISHPRTETFLFSFFQIFAMADSGWVALYCEKYVLCKNSLGEMLVYKSANFPSIKPDNSKFLQLQMWWTCGLLWRVLFSI